MNQRTYFMIKPEGVERGLVGGIIARVEARGLALRGMKLVRIARELAEEHYAEHRERPFFSEVVESLTRAPVVAMVVEGPNAVQAIRTMAGATDPIEATPGSIRGDHATTIGENVVHSAADPEAAEREIALYFSEDELAGRAVGPVRSAVHS